MENKNFTENIGDEDPLKTVMLDGFEKNVYVGISSVIGSRDEQQDTIIADTYFSYVERGKLIAVLCDGMGGLSGGSKASELCSSIIYKKFYENQPDANIPQFYSEVIAEADDSVHDLTDENGKQLGAGTTMVSVVVAGEDLYWASVGDSLIYIVRGREILPVNQCHNLSMILNERVKKGEITVEEAESHPKKEALVSYIGIGGVRYIDINNKPFRLQHGDFIVLCSDGLYRSVTDEEIIRTVKEYGNETKLAAEALTDLAISKNIPYQDNTSVVVIGYEDSG